MQYFVDGSGLRLTNEDDAALVAIEDFLELVEAARLHEDEPIWRTDDIYDFEVRPGQLLVDFVYSPEAPRSLKDALRRLGTLLDRLPACEPNAFDAKLGQDVLWAPGLAEACLRQHRGERTACLVFASAGRPGAMEVEVETASVVMTFLARPVDRILFLRGTFAADDVPMKQFGSLAERAFPALRWADGIWGTIKDFRQDYQTIRNHLVSCLSGLNDLGAATFQAYREPRELAKRISLAVGYETSSENGEAMQNRRAAKDRERVWSGESHVFWWHSKLYSYHDRIHFMHIPKASEDDPDEGFLVVGFFTEHAWLPG